MSGFFFGKFLNQDFQDERMRRITMKIIYCFTIDLIPENLKILQILIQKKIAILSRNERLFFWKISESGFSR